MHLAFSELVDGLCLLKAQIGMASQSLCTNSVDVYRFDDDGIDEEVLEDSVGEVLHAFGFEHLLNVGEAP